MKHIPKITGGVVGVTTWVLCMSAILNTYRDTTDYLAMSLIGAFITFGVIEGTIWLISYLISRKNKESHNES